VENLLTPLLAGFICGFVVSVPIGPVNLTVINHALRKGFRNAFFIGAGAIVAETLYATLMLWGHTSILDEHHARLVLRVAAIVVITALGIRYLVFKPERLDASKVTAEKVEERWHHPRSFFLGFVLTISNFMLVVLWATLVTLLFAHEWVVPMRESRSLCAMGVLLGGLAWFFLLAFFVSRAHRRVNNETLLVLVRGCGALFLGFAVVLTYRLLVSVTTS